MQPKQPGIAQRAELWVVPVALQGEYLVWAPLPVSKKHRGQPLTERFRQLGSATDQDILKFASQFGVLGVDTCGNSPAAGNFGEYDLPEAVPAELQSSPGVLPEILRAEALYHWRRFADTVDAILAAAARLRLGLIPDDQTLQRFHHHRLRHRRIRSLEAYATMIRKSQREAARILLIAEVNAWLQMGQTAPQLEAEGDTWRITSGAWGNPNLLGHIALDLMASVIEGSYASCSGCGRAFTTTRAPKQGQQSWCPQCKSNGTMGRILKRQERHRKP